MDYSCKTCLNEEKNVFLRSLKMCIYTKSKSIEYGYKQR